MPTNNIEEIRKRLMYTDFTSSDHKKFNDVWVPNKDYSFIDIESNTQPVFLKKMLGNIELTREQLSIWVETYFSLKSDIEKAQSEKRYMDALELLQSAFPSGMFLSQWKFKNEDDLNFGYLLTDIQKKYSPSEGEPILLSVNHTAIDVKVFITSYLQHAISCYSDLNKLKTAEKILTNLPFLTDATPKSVITSPKHTGSSRLFDTSHQQASSSNENTSEDRHSPTLK